MAFDVVIAAGGPTGLMPACELALSRVRPLPPESRTGQRGCAAGPGGPPGAA